MPQKKTQFETVNFRLYIKVIIGQTETQYFAAKISQIYTTWRVFQFALLNDLSPPSDYLYPIGILVLNYYKILHSTKSNNYNILAFLEAALLIKRNKPFLTLDLRPVKNYNFSPNYSNVLLLVGSFFCDIKHCCKCSKLLYFDQPFFHTHVKRFLSTLYISKL